MLDKLSFDLRKKDPLTRIKKLESFYDNINPETIKLINENHLIYFEKMPSKYKNKLNKFLSKYILAFSKDELEAIRTNYPLFKFHYQGICSDLKDNYENYGDTFTLKAGIPFLDIILNCHTLYYLESQNYIEVKDITMDTSLTGHTKAYIRLKNKFINEHIQKRPKSKKLRFKDRVLYIQDKQIQISQNENNRDVLFLNIIFSDRKKNLVYG